MAYFFLFFNQWFLQYFFFLVQTLVKPHKKKINHFEKQIHYNTLYVIIIIINSIQFYLCLTMAVDDDDFSCSTTSTRIGGIYNADIIYRHRKTGKINKQLSYNVRNSIIIKPIDLTDNDPPSTLPPPSTPSVPSTVQYNRITPLTKESVESILYDETSGIDTSGFIQTIRKRPRQSIMAVSKKNDDDSTYQDDSDDSDTVPSSPKKTSEELFQLAANATLPARRRIQPNIYGSTPSPPPPLSKPITSKKKPTTSKKNAPLVNSARTNQSNPTKKKRGRAATKKKSTTTSIITTSAPINVRPAIHPCL